ncbi:unnamed protein product [Menidia menidia]|uniref:(Atlantic silverside) hypothetical protein n=1 Tax=Menidia menidia TaxID=238744 RepID=A0A8S4AX41_9TELE|nr:unnamed protein product [Menidia menidia]
MGNTRSLLAASLSLCSVSLVFFHFYSSHQLLKAEVLSGDRLPSFFYLHVKYLLRAVTRSSGRLYPAAAPGARKAVYTVRDCRLDASLLRRFCSVAGYGWDYPDSEHRDVPLCFPESLQSLQPVDELKKGPFVLQARVLGYRQAAAGVEVDIRLSAASRSGCPVWESVLTLLSEERPGKAGGCLPEKGPPDEPAPETEKRVELRVSRTTGTHCDWSFSDYSPHRILALPARVLGLARPTAPGLWILSVCLAEIEKHKGVGPLTAPVSVTALFQEPLAVPGHVGVRFWEETEAVGQPSTKGLSFRMETPGRSISHIVGRISRF